MGALRAVYSLRSVRSVRTSYGQRGTNRRALCHALNGHITVDETRLGSKPPDAVVVLAGGQTADGGNPEWVTRRLDACVDLYRRFGCTVVCSGGGTPHRPPILNASKYVVFESMGCAEYLLNCGVPAVDIVREVSSFDTIGNGYFTMAIHAIPRKWSRLAVVTSEFHMPRSRAIFTKLCALAERAGHGPFALSFVEVSDEGVFPDEVLAARQEREAQSLKRWEEDMSVIETFEDFSEWLHLTHLCYAVPRQSEFGVPTALDDVALQSY